MKLSQYNIFKQQNNFTQIFNTYTGAIVSLENEYYNSLLEYLRNGDNTLISDEDIYTLTNLGIIVNCEANELEAVLQEIGFNDDNQISITIFVTEDCNFDCKYCYERHRSKKLHNETWCKLLEYIKVKIDNNSLKKLRIDFFGGEPLLEYENIVSFLVQLKEIVQLVDNFEFLGSIVTNGYLLNKERFVELTTLGVKLYQITIDGFAHTHNDRRPLKNGQPTFDVIMKNLRDIHILDTMATVRIRTNIDEEVENEYHKFLKEIKNRFGDRFQVQYDVVKKYGVNNKLKLLNSNELDLCNRINNYCRELGLDSSVKISKNSFICSQSGQNSFTVLVDGSIGKCTVYYDNEKMRVGPLTHEGLIEHNSNYQYWERRIDEQCKSCNILPLCKNQTCKAPLILNGNKSCRREYILQLIEGELNNATQ